MLLKTNYYEVDIYTDGSSRPNPGPSGIAIRIIDPLTDAVLFENAGYVGTTTIVKAEYYAVIHGLEVARREFTCRKVNLFSDNLIVVKQINKMFRVKTESLDPFFLRTRKLIDNYFKEGVEILHVSEADLIPSFKREYHKYCDEKAKMAVKNRKPVVKISV